jgi:ribosomal-protein-alanine N-acetyltransferase
MGNSLDKLPVINTQRLLLRESSDEDVKVMYEIYSHPDVVRYWDHVAWTDKSQASDLIRSAQNGFSNGETFFWCICKGTTGELIGTCALRDYSQNHRTAEILYALLPHYWGQGLVSEILPEIISFGFNTLDLNRIHAETEPRNVASKKALLRTGFKEEGRLRESWIYPGETPTDIILLGLLRSDWIQTKT